MKNQIKKSLLFVALGIVFCCTANNFAQINEPIAGGYQTIEVTAPQIISAADFAVKAQAKKQKAKIKLVSVRKAEQQVVAGMNYNLCLQVETREKKKKTAVPQTIQATVFLNLNQKYELSAWAIAACTDEIVPQTPIK